MQALRKFSLDIPCSRISLMISLPTAVQFSGSPGMRQSCRHIASSVACAASPGRSGNAKAHRAHAACGDGPNASGF
jgi:hypothetical protein